MCVCVCLCVCVRVCACIYIYIYIQREREREGRGEVFYNPVYPEYGTNPLGQINYSNFEYSNIPGKELNLNKFIEQIILFKRKIKLFFGRMLIINLFPSC